MDNATAAELWARARLQWREAVELGLHDSEDIVYGILPLLVQGLREDPDHLPSLDLLSDMLMEIGAYEEAVEFAEKVLDLDRSELADRHFSIDQLIDTRNNLYPAAGFLAEAEDVLPLLAGSGRDSEDDVLERRNIGPSTE